MSDKKLLSLLILLFFVISASVYASDIQPTKPDPNPEMDKKLLIIKSLANFKKISEVILTESDSKLRFNTHMELVRISSPSRQELYRGMEVAKRFKAIGYSDDEIVFSVDGVIPGAAIQLIDELPVWNACAIVKGSQPDSIVNGKDIFSRPKVLIEAHIDSVNPSSINISDKSKIPASAYDKIRIDNVNNPLADSPAKLAALTKYLSFDSDGKIIEDQNYKDAYQRYSTSDEAKKANAYRIYIPGYGDAMGNVNGILNVARYLKEYPIKPVQDIWICATSGEEGRGNLAGMKQLYGYNQNASKGEAPSLEYKGKNSLNFVANLSIDGGNMTIHYLGSYRFEVNYTTNDPDANAAVSAAYAIDLISNVKTPNEIDSSKPRTTYTVGVVYPVIDGTRSTSFEIDMRSPVPSTLDEVRATIEPLFAKGAELENKRVGKNVVQYSIKWFGDRPAHRRMPDQMSKDPLIYAGWQSYCMVNGVCPKELEQYPIRSSSLNDNIPAAIGVPSINITLSTRVMGGGGHSFNEWGIPSTIKSESDSFNRVLLTLFATAGVTDANTGKVIVPPAYPNIGPRHVNVNVDKWNQ